MKKFFYFPVFIIILSSCYNMYNPYQPSDRDLGNTLYFNLSGAKDRENKKLFCLVYENSMDNTADFAAKAYEDIQDGNASGYSYIRDLSSVNKFPRDTLVDILCYIDDRVQAVYLENATSLSSYNLLGSFGTAECLYKYEGPNDLSQGVDYDYYNRLDFGDNVHYDYSDSGEFGNNRWVRIVYDGVNISNMDDGLDAVITA